MKKILFLLFICAFQISFSQFEFTVLDKDDIIISKISFPSLRFSDIESIGIEQHDRNVRYAVIEYGKGTNLYKLNTRKCQIEKLHDFKTINGEKFVRKNSCNVKSCIVLLAKGFDKSTIEKYTFTIEETDITYANEFYENINDYSEVDSHAYGITNKNNFTSSKTPREENIEYLKDIKAILQNSQNSMLTESSIVKIKSFSIVFNEKIKNLESLKHAFTDEELSIIKYISSWTPLYTVITPLAYKVGENDMVTIKVKEEENTIKNIQRFRNAGVLKFSIATNLYITGLHDNKYYKDSIKIDSTMEYRVFLEDNKKKIDIGVGVSGNLEISTGSIYSHTFNVGMFVPFKEQPVPNLAFGSGFTLWNTRVKFNAHAGVAVGQVNIINEKYTNTDLSNKAYLDSDLINKKWKASWYTALGISYNLSK